MVGINAWIAFSATQLTIYCLSITMMFMNWHKQIGPALKALRKDRGLNQAQLADRLGKGRPTIARMESLRANPAWSTICASLEALEATPQDLARKVHELTRTEWSLLPEESEGLDRAASALEQVARELRRLG